MSDRLKVVDYTDLELAVSFEIKARKAEKKVSELEQQVEVMGEVILEEVTSHDEICVCGICVFYVYLETLKENKK